jgi:uncharacterized protein YbbK (DUF523 family)
MNSKPVIFASRCLGFAATRYNAQIILDEWVERLKPFVCFIDLCPEADIGLGVPRDPLRLVKEKDEIMFFQPATGIDYTERMNSYIGKAIESLPPSTGSSSKAVPFLRYRGCEAVRRDRQRRSDCQTAVSGEPR